MANNDAFSFTATEPDLVPAGATTRSDGVTIEPQATRMGIAVVVGLATANPLDSVYTITVETADEGDLPGNSWAENTTDSVTFNATGTYLIELAVPVFDQTRIRVDAVGAHPEYANISASWLSDTPLTLN